MLRCVEGWRSHSSHRRHQARDGREGNNSERPLFFASDYRGWLWPSENSQCQGREYPLRTLARFRRTTCRPKIVGRGPISEPLIELIRERTVTSTTPFISATVNRFRIYVHLSRVVWIKRAHVDNLGEGFKRNVGRFAPLGHCIPTSDGKNRSEESGQPWRRSQPDFRYSPHGSRAAKSPPRSD